MRWRIAYALDRLPGMCWASLVPWALGWDQPLREARISGICRSDAARTGRCYCGKIKSSVPILTIDIEGQR
jgi:hypothetical protein